LGERAKTDEELMSSFQSGSLEAFNALYSRYKSPVFSFLVRLTASRENAEELTQEVFMRVVRGSASFRGGSKFSTWIYTIARNQHIDAMRKKKHRNHASLDQPSGPDSQALGERLPGDEPGPERGSMGARLRRDLAARIAELPDEQREVFLLREYSGLSFAEISEVVGAKEGTVKSRMRYALENLRGGLAQYADYARTLP
jgi:RNA polymerase sigma-70 factor (ECF subfamily)